MCKNHAVLRPNVNMKIGTVVLRLEWKKCVFHVMRIYPTFWMNG